MSRRVVRAVNTVIVVRDCSESLDNRLIIGDGSILIKSSSEDVEGKIRVNGKDVKKLCDIPEELVNSVIEILDKDILLLAYELDLEQQERGMYIHVCFTDGEYAHIIPISLEDINKVVFCELAWKGEETKKRLISMKMNR